VTTYRSLLFFCLHLGKINEPIINSITSQHEIVQKLRKLGAGKDAYIVSENWDVDGKTGNLEEIVSLVSGNGDIVYCLGTKLGYYEGHENWNYIFNANK
jgi:hypothetical protein